MVAVGEVGEIVKPSEHAEQVIVVDWLDHIASRRWPHLAVLDGRLTWFAVPNGGQRNVIVATRLKREGVRAGVPDLAIMIPRGGHGALFVEMKALKGGRASKAQKEWHWALRSMGYRVEVCRGSAAAIEMIETYLNGGMQ